MTNDEARRWFESGLTDDQLILMIQELMSIKMAAGHRFGVATAGADWVERFLAKVNDLQDANGERMVLARQIEAAMLTMKNRLRCRPCRNCRGEKEVDGRTCVCCNGTGMFDM